MRKFQIVWQVMEDNQFVEGGIKEIISSSLRLSVQIAEDQIREQFPGAEFQMIQVTSEPHND